MKEEYLVNLYINAYIYIMVKHLGKITSNSYTMTCSIHDTHFLMCHVSKPLLVEDATTRA